MAHWLPHNEMALFFLTDWESITCKKVLYYWWCHESYLWMALRHARACVRVHTCVCVCVYVHLHVCAYTCVRVRMCEFGCVWLCTHPRVPVGPTSVWVSVCLCCVWNWSLITIDSSAPFSDGRLSGCSIVAVARRRCRRNDADSHGRIIGGNVYCKGSREGQLQKLEWTCSQ